MPVGAGRSGRPARALDGQVAQAAADAVVGQVEQQARAVVDQGDPLVRVETMRPSLTPWSIASRCSTRPGDLLRLQAEGLALDPAGEQQRPGDPERAGDAEVGDQVGTDARQRCSTEG